eukprot:14625713-Alexandrium_andersonii.AAC.1
MTFELPESKGHRSVRFASSSFYRACYVSPTVPMIVLANKECESNARLLWIGTSRGRSTSAASKLSGRHRERA